MRTPAARSDSIPSTTPSFPNDGVILSDEGVEGPHPLAMTHDSLNTNPNSKLIIMRIAKPEEQFDLISPEDQQERAANFEKFPFSVIVEGSYPEMDNALRWCWNTFGPRHGKCGGWGRVEYTGCPIILATEFTEEVQIQGKTQIKKRYCEVPEHSHEGNWTDCWLAKTDYDHGYAEFFFNRIDDLQIFISQVPEITWGENYPSG